MKIYSKILFITLPLILIPTLLVGILSYQLSRNAIQGMAQEVLVPRLTSAMEICIENEAVLREYGLEQIPANVTKAQADAASLIEDIRFGDTGYVFVVDSQGIIRAHPDAALVGRDVSGEEWVQEIIRAERGDIRYDWQGEKRWATFETFDPWNWRIVSNSAESELTSVIDRLGVYIVWLLAISLIVATVALLLLARWLTRPIASLIAGTERIRQGELETQIPITSSDEIGELARAFNSMTGQLREFVGSLEQQVAERTGDLERRAAQLQAASEVGYAASSILGTEELFSQVVELIREHFVLYFVGLYLVEENEEWAILQAGSGEAGQAMLRRGHRRRMGEGLVGWCIANAQARVAADVRTDVAYAVTAELPDTRSEAALPLRSRGRVLGALTVQSDQPGAFDRDTLAVLQTMADQVAVALDNATLFAESQKALEASRRAYGEISREAWSGLLGARDEWGYRYARQTVASVEGSWRPRMVQAAQEGQVRQGGDGDETSAVAVPLKVRDQVVGVLDFRKGKANGTWTEAQVHLLEALADQLGAALESARLYQDSQRRALHEQLVGQITRRVRETLDVDTVLRTVADEIYSTLGLNEVVVRLATQAPIQLVAIVASLPLLPGQQLCSGRDAANAIRLALEDANYRTGNFVVKLEIWDNSGPEDDVWQTEIEAANAERAVADPDVLVYLGPSVSEGCKISLPILNQGGLAQVEAGATYPGLTKAGYEPGEPEIYYPTGERTFFRLSATDDLQGPAGALWAQEQGLERVYIVQMEDVYGRELARTFQEAAKIAGLTVVGTNTIASGQSGGFDEILTAIADQLPDLIYYTGFDTIGIPLIRALRTAGITTALMSGDGLYVSALIENLGTYAEGIMVTVPGTSMVDLGEAGQEFAQRFYQRFGYEPGGWAALSYDGALLALAAIEQAGVADRAAVVQALRQIEFEGLLNRYSFDENGDSRPLLVSGVRVERGAWQSRGLLRLPLLDQGAIPARRSAESSNGG